MPRNHYPGAKKVVLIIDKVEQTNVNFGDFINHPILSQIIKPNQQGSLLEDKVNDMVVEYQKKPYFFAHKRSITIAVLNNNFYIADGQHRIEAAKRLYQDHGIDKEYFICIWHIVKDEGDMRELFNSINKDSVKNDFYVSQDVFIQTRVDMFMTFFKAPPNGWHKSFAKSFSIKGKKLPLETVRDKLIETQLFEKEKHIELGIFEDFKPNESYIDYICRSNQEFYNRKGYENELAFLDRIYYKDDIALIIEKKIMIIANTNFFEWLPRKHIIKIKHDMRKNKTCIPPHLRKLVWNQAHTADKSTAECPFFNICKTNINTTEKNGFHCGHVISEFNGGAAHISNLRPICASCNSSMGFQNWDDYEKQITLFTL